MKRRWLHAAIAALLLASAPAYAQQDDTPGENLGGYDTAATAAAISFQPFLPALVSTGDVPFEVTFAHSTSRVKSGGNALGRGALLWPGSTAADMGPVLGAGFGQNEVGALIPKWPLQANANQGRGDVKTGVDPIVMMSAKGYPDRGEGDSRIADIHIPGLIHVENIASTSSSVVTDQSVTSTARVALHGVTLLGGYVKAEKIRSVSRTTSTGGAASSSGDVDIVGLRIGGVEVSVTDDGFHVTGLPPDFEQVPGAGDEPVPNSSPEKVVNSILKSLGARITLFESFSKTSGSQTQRMQPGVVISLDNPLGGQGPIPPGRFDVYLASTSSSSLSTLPFSGDVGSVLPPNVSSDGGGGSPSISLGDGPQVAGTSVSNVGDDLSGASTDALGPIGEGVPGVSSSSDYKFDGLPVAMVLLLLAVALLAARYIRRFFDSLITGEAGSSRSQEDS